MDVSKGLSPGTVLHGAYRIERILGQGGFGITYLAFETRLERHVAIKEFFPKDFCDRESTTSHVTLGSGDTKALVETLKAKFLREAKYIAKLDHPGIIKIHTAFEENQTAYYVMDYIQGSNLSQMVKERMQTGEGPLPEKEALRYVRMVGEALDYLHSHSMNHFDVKPANILIRESDDRPVLIDFGLSKQYGDAAHKATTTLMGMSQGYAPMEQYVAGGVKEFSPPTDIYALAATLYFLLSGVAPPDAPSLADQELMFPAQIPPRLIKPISKAMSTARSRRHESVSRFLEDLSETAPTPMTAAPPVTVTHSETAPHPETAATPADGKTNETPANGVTNGPRARSYSWIWFLAAVGIGFAVWWAADSLRHDSSPGTDTAGNNRQPGDTVLIVEELPGESPRGQSGSKLTDQPPGGRVTGGRLVSDGEGPDNTSAPGVTVTLPEGPQTTLSSLKEMSAMGADAYQRHEYAEAIKWCRLAADKGSAESQLLLGEIYLYGKGVEENHTEAAKWYRKAAQQNMVKAQFILGTLLYLGDGVSQNYTEAYSWASKAAAKGDPGAQFLLGEMHASGSGVPKSIEEAAKWYRKAADQGNSAAKEVLDDLYSN